MKALQSKSHFLAVARTAGFRTSRKSQNTSKVVMSHQGSRQLRFLARKGSGLPARNWGLIASSARRALNGVRPDAQCVSP